MTDKVLYNSRGYHQGCFRCADCKKTLNISTMGSVDQSVYCNMCYKKASESRFQHKPASAPQHGGSSGSSQGDICPKCEKRVYFAESVTALSKRFHQACLKCTSCSKRLEPGTFCDKDEELYCKSCYTKNFGPKGYGYGQGAGALFLTK